MHWLVLFNRKKPKLNVHKMVRFFFVSCNPHHNSLVEKIFQMMLRNENVGPFSDATVCQCMSVCVAVVCLNEP